MSSARAIEAFVSQPAIAVVGVSRTGGRFGNSACQTLLEKGYRVYPIHPHAAKIRGMKVYSCFSALPEPVDAALIVVPPAQAVKVIQDAAAAGVHHVWLQQGAESAEAIALASTLGLDVVAGECILMFAKPTGIHRLHRQVRAVLGTLPV